MDTAIIRKKAEKLKKRRDQLAAALKRLDEEPNQIEHNPDWIDQAASETSVNVHDHLKERYLTEIGQMDSALTRIERNQYGFCLACHHVIEPHRLETAPETEYCSDCQDMREEVQRV